MDFEYNEQGQRIAPCSVCGQWHPITEMKHYGREQFLVEEDYHCQACEQKIEEELRRFDREQQEKWYPLEAQRKAQKAQAQA